MKESQLENKTSIATNDYVRMVDENGNSVKIKKDSFMAAIRDALPSIISDGETGGGSVLSIINGALKTRTDANLASVLGAFGAVKTDRNMFSNDVNNMRKTGLYKITPDKETQNLPSDFDNGKTAVMVVFNFDASYQKICVQFAMRYDPLVFKYRFQWVNVWSGWISLI